MTIKVDADAVADNAHAGGRMRYVLNWVEGCLRKLLRFARQFPYRIAHRSRVAAADLSRYDLVEKGFYDYVPKGTYVYGPRSDYLIIRKNRYRISLLPDQEKRTDCGVGWITEDNSASSYDQLWGDDKILSQFRLEGDGIRTRLIEEIADQVAPLTREAARIVDVGCGVGDLLVALQRRCPSISTYGCDFSEKAIAGAKERLPDGEFLKHEISRLPYGSQTFEAVLCTDTLEHLEQPGQVVEELVRICVPGGVVVIVVPDGDVDGFSGHLWFWGEKSLGLFLAPWRPEVKKLPQTKELLAVIRVADDSNGDTERVR